MRCGACQVTYIVEDVNNADLIPDRIALALDQLRFAPPLSVRRHHGHGGQGSRGGRPRGHGPRGGRGHGGGAAFTRLLLTLLRAAGPLGVSELAQAVDVDQPRASRLVAQGVQDGLLERETDPEDARRAVIALTTAGREAAERVLNRRRARVVGALDQFSEDEKQTLAHLLTRFADGFK